MTQEQEYYEIIGSPEMEHLQYRLEHPEIKKESCYYCNDKGYSTQMKGLYGAADLGHPGFYEYPTIQKNYCKKCKKGRELAKSEAKTFS